MRSQHTILVSALAVALTIPVAGQGTFQNLDFENAVMVTISGDPYGRCQFHSALPGWAGYLGTNQTDRVACNDVSLGVANISVLGPDYPTAGLFHGRFFVVLQGGDDPFGSGGRVGVSLVQDGTLPATARSIRFYLAYGAVLVSFSGQSIPIALLASSPSGYNIYGGDISALAGQTGELRFQGGGWLDYIQFSDQSIPEPGPVTLFALGALALAWGMRNQNA